MEEISIETIIKTLKDISSEEELLLYKDLGNGLYELPGCIICNKTGLNEYLKTINNNRQSRSSCRNREA